MNRIFTVNRTQDLHYAEAVIMIMTEDKPGAPTSQGIMGNNPKKGDSGPMAPRHPSLLALEGLEGEILGRSRKGVPTEGTARAKTQR